MQEVLTAKNLTKTFSLPAQEQQISWKESTTRKIVINSVSLSLQEGEILGILGTRDSGKSTLLKLLATLIKPNAGSVTIQGHDSIKSRAKAREGLTYITADMTPDQFRTPSQLFDDYSCFYDVVPETAQERKQTLFRCLGIEKYAQKKLSKCPKSIRPLVNIAISMIHDPKIILLDDPTGNMDPVGVHNFAKFLQSLKASGKSIILASCTASLIEQACSRVGFLMDGKLTFPEAQPDLENQFVEFYNATKGEYDYE